MQCNLIAIRSRGNRRAVSHETQNNYGYELSVNNFRSTSAGPCRANGLYDSVRVHDSLLASEPHLSHWTPYCTFLGMFRSVLQQMNYSSPSTFTFFRNPGTWQDVWWNQSTASVELGCSIPLCSTSNCGLLGHYRVTVCGWKTLQDSARRRAWKLLIVCGNEVSAAGFQRKLGARICDALTLGIARHFKWEVGLFNLEEKHNFKSYCNKNKPIEISV